MKTIAKQYKKLVFACAWCPAPRRVLKKSEAYTHGMCLKHKKEFIRGVRLRHAQSS